MVDCIFCKIASGEAKSWKVYEDDLVIAFFDINPEALGHVLIAPKKHFQDIYDIEEKYIERIASVSKKVAIALKKSLGVNDVNLIHGSGKNAQQDVFHFHMHVWPRYEKDTIKLHYDPLLDLRDQFDEVLEKIKKHMK